MREILFRGKCVDNGEWIEGIALLHDNRGKVTMFRRNVDFPDSLGRSFDYFFTIPLNLL